MILINAIQQIEIAGANAASLQATTQNGDFIATDFLSVTNAVTLNIGGAISAFDIMAGSISASALTDVSVNGLWLAPVVEIAGQNLTIADQAAIDTGIGGFIDIRSTNPNGLLLSLIHISEPTRLLSISYAVFCLKKKNV